MDFNFLTRDDVTFTEDRGIVINHSDVSLKGYKGVTRVLNAGEPTFLEKLTAQHGAKKAAEICAKSSQRGKRLHTKLETNHEEMLTPTILTGLGQLVAVEVLTYGKLFGLNMVGFIDAIFMNNGILTLVDYKTKNKPYYAQSFEKYWLQLTGYVMLMANQYGIDPKTTKLATILIYGDGSEPCYKTLQCPKAKRRYAMQLKKKALILSNT